MKKPDSHIHAPFVFRLFLRLREAGYRLGIPEYQDLLKALQGGFGVGEKQELLQLCQMLWMPYHEDRYDFQIYFLEVWERMKSEKRAQEVAEKLVEESSEELEEEESSGRYEEEALEDLPDLPQKGEMEPTPQVPEIPTLEDFSSGYVPAILTPPVFDDEIPIMLGTISVEREFLPFHRRQLQQHWRSLRRTQREGIKTELDIPETLKRIHEESMYLEPVFVAPRKNTTRLILLLDHGGSMVAFHPFGEELKRTASNGGFFQSVDSFYFYNLPDQVLYTDTAHTEYQSLSQVFSPSRAKRSLLIIYSDGGAAREHYKQDRITATQQFLQSLKPRVRRIAWINPMPSSRWWDTSAEEIREALPEKAMFQGNSEGIRKAIQFLKGSNKR